MARDAQWRLAIQEYQALPTAKRRKTEALYEKNKTMSFDTTALVNAIFETLDIRVIGVNDDIRVIGVNETMVQEYDDAIAGAEIMAQLEEK